MLFVYTVNRGCNNYYLKTDMRNFSRQRKLKDVLNELWADLKDKIFGPEPKLKPIPVRNEKR